MPISSYASHNQQHHIDGKPNQSLPELALRNLSIKLTKITTTLCVPKPIKHTPNKRLIRKATHIPISKHLYTQNASNLPKIIPKNGNNKLLTQTTIKLSPKTIALRIMKT